jgi:O-methyltransferase domain/Dimerisation domain
MVKPIEDVRDISRIAYGFIASKALFSALHLDVFSRLEKRPQTARELATDAGVAEPRMQTLLSGDVEHLAGVLHSTQMADAHEADQFSRAQHAGSLGPELQATILDFPNVVRVAHRYVAEAGLADRVEFVSGNALDVAWPSADVVLMSYLLSAVSGPDIRRLLERARDTLSPAGTVLVHDFMLDDDRQGPDLAALWFLQYVAVSADPVPLTRADVTALMTEIGLVDIVSEPLIPDITRLVSAVRPNT